MSPTARRWLNRIFSLACVLFLAVSIFNVYGDNSGVERLAAEAASCVGERCAPSRIDRTPFSQEYEFTTKGHTSLVRCVRAGILVGAFDCRKK